MGGGGEGGVHNTGAGGARYRPSISPDQPLGIGATQNFAPLGTQAQQEQDGSDAKRLRPHRLSGWQLDRNVENVVAERKYKAMQGSLSSNTEAAERTSVRRRGVAVRHPDDSDLKALGRASGEVANENAGDIYRRRLREIVQREEKEPGKAFFAALTEEQDAYLQERSKQFPGDPCPIRSSRRAQAGRDLKQDGVWFGLVDRW